MYAIILILLAVAPSLAFATDHFNLERGIPTTIEDIEPIERGSFELQGFARYSRLRGEKKNAGEAEPRLAVGIFDKTQLEIATPLLLGEGVASGNGDVQISVLRKLWDDQQGAWRPGVALEADVRLPTGAEKRGFKNRVDAGNMFWLPTARINTVSVIDPIPYKVIQTISTGKGPHGFRISKDSNYAYSANMGRRHGKRYQPI